MDILWWWKCGWLDLRLGVGEGATLTGWLGLVERDTKTRGATSRCAKSGH